MTHRLKYFLFTILSISFAVNAITQELPKNWHLLDNEKDGFNLPAKFTNFGKFSIDIFAPGVDIYATLPNNEYGTRSGTSMAAPVASGVAALLLSYFPNLTPEQVITILKESGSTYNSNVLEPGTDKKIPFANLSKTGKIINAYKAVKLALEKYNN